MESIFDMGRHTFYVWLSYGVSVAVLSALIFVSIKSKKDALRQASKKIKRNQSLTSERISETTT